MVNTYGYIRVSSKDQNEERQVRAMENFGVPCSNVFFDAQSGKDFNRPGYRRLIQKIKPGDTLVIKSIDRLGRNYNEILEQWRIITKEKRAEVVVLDIPLLDTRNGRDLMGSLIADIVLQLLSYVAQTERDFIRQRQREGIEAARERGVHLGRRAKEHPKEFEKVKKAWEQGEISAKNAAKQLGVSFPTFKKWIQSEKKKYLNSEEF